MHTEDWDTEPGPVLSLSLAMYSALTLSSTLLLALPCFYTFYAFTPSSWLHGVYPYIYGTENRCGNIYVLLRTVYVKHVLRRVTPFT